VWLIFRVATQFREIMHCRHLPYVIVHGTQTSQVPSEKEEVSATNNEKMESKRANLGRLPIEWVIGPYIPVQEPLHPLSTAQGGQNYLRQTFLTAGSYAARMFSASIDQARGEPYKWGGGTRRG